MKKLFYVTMVIAASWLMASCSDNNSYEKFVGTWGLTRADYYYVDYAGVPIEDTRETYYFTAGDEKDGIDLVFKSDKTGQRIDRSRDTLIIQTGTNPDTYDTIPCQDTIIYSSFTYSYDADEETLYMTTPDNGRTHALKIRNFTDNGFSYYNQYKISGNPYAEEAVLERISNKTSKAATRGRKIYAPHKPGSFLFN